MPKKKFDKGLTREHLWKIWGFLGAQGWSEILQKNKRHHNFVPAGQETLKGLCVHPDHQDTTASFYLYIGKGYAKCFGGSCEYYESNPLRLLSHILDCSYADALRYLQDHYKPPFIPRKALAELEAQRRNQDMKQEVYRTAHQMMCEAISTPNKPDYAYTKQALDWLINTRKLPKEVLHALPIAIMPELDRLAEHMQDRHLLRVKAWERAKNPQLAPPEELFTPAVDYLGDSVRNTVFTGSVLFPLHVTPKEIGRLKLRAPHSAAKKDIIMPDDDFENLIGLYGLGWDMYKPFMGNGKNSGFAYIVEGEFDALTLMAQCAIKGNVKFPIISAGGRSAAANIEPILNSSGITKAFFIGDSPTKGDNPIQSWLECMHQVETKIFVGWDALPGAGDPDDAVLRYGDTAVIKAFWDDADQNFIPAWSWAFERAALEMEDHTEDDFRRRMETAAEHGRYLKHHLECERYAEEIEARFSLSKSLLKREITSRDSSEMGFIQSCADAISEMMHIVGTRDIAYNRHLVMYDKKLRSFRDIKLDSEQSLIQQLAPIAGLPIRFVEEHVGRPPFLEWPDPSNPEHLVYTETTGKLRRYLTAAVVSLTQGVPELEQARRLSQGYHCVESGSTDKDEYVVCGTDIFHFCREGESLNYKKLDGPSHHGHFFDIGLTDKSPSPSWYPGGITKELLDAQKDTDLPKLYDDLVNLYSKGFRFQNHETTCELLAALVMCFPVMTAFEHPILTFITGDTGSGKTSLLSTFCELGENGIRLLYASQGRETYTAAGVARLMDCNSLLTALDEFESEDNERGTHVMRITEMLRPLVSGEAKRIIAKPDGSTFSQSFCLPVIFSAIRGAQRPQDLNRVLLIEMHKIEHKDSPINVIHNALGKPRIDEMIKELNFGLYPQAQELARLEKDIKKNFSDLQQSLHMPIAWRTASNLFAPLAMLRFLGKDWRSFLKRYVKANEHSINRTTTVSETDNMLSSIMYNAVIPQADGSPASIALMLHSPETREEINTANKGIYYDSTLHQLLIQVDQGISLLHYHQRMHMTGSHLRTILERHPSAIKPQEIEDSGILQRVGQFLGAGIRLQDVAVINVERWLTAEAPPAPATVNSPAEDAKKEPTDGSKEDEIKDKDASDYDW